MWRSNSESGILVSVAPIKFQLVQTTESERSTVTDGVFCTGCRHSFALQNDIAKLWYTVRKKFRKISVLSPNFFSAALILQFSNIITLVNSMQNEDYYYGTVHTPVNFRLICKKSKKSEFWNRRLSLAMVTRTRRLPIRRSVTSHSRHQSQSPQSRIAWQTIDIKVTLDLFASTYRRTPTLANPSRPSLTRHDPRRLRPHATLVSSSPSSLARRQREWQKQISLYFHPSGVPSSALYLATRVFFFLISPARDHINSELICVVSL